MVLVIFGHLSVCLLNSTQAVIYYIYLYIHACFVPDEVIHFNIFCVIPVFLALSALQLKT